MPKKQTNSMGHDYERKELWKYDKDPPILLGYLKNEKNGLQLVFLLAFYDMHLLLEAGLRTSHSQTLSLCGIYCQFYDCEIDCVSLVWFTGLGLVQ